MNFYYINNKKKKQFRFFSLNRFIKFYLVLQMHFDVQRLHQITKQLHQQINPQYQFLVVQRH